MFASTKRSFAMTNLPARVLAATAFAVMLSVGAVASAQERESPFSALGRLFGNADQPTGSTGNRQIAQGSEADHVVRIEQLEAQIRRLTGTIEQLQYRNQQLEAQLQRMGAAPGQPPQAGMQPPRPPVHAAPGPGPGAAPLPPVTGRRSDAFDPTLHPNAPGAPQTLGALPGTSHEPPPIITAEPPVGAPGGRDLGAPLDLSTLATRMPPQHGPGVSGDQLPPINSPLPPPPARRLSATGAVAPVLPPSDSPKDYFDLGYGYLLRKDYALAEDTLQAFLKKYPSDRLVPDAHFWLGESLFQRQKYDGAASAFLEVSTKHSAHPKAAESMLRLGQSLAALGQKEMACATLAEAKRKYPRAAGSVKQGVDQEQKRARC